MPKKTFKVEDLVQMVNSVCQYSSSEHVERRQGAMNVLEEILHRTGNYKGFRYLLAEDILAGKPGVNYENGVPHPNYEKRFENTDRTRVMYY